MTARWRDHLGVPAERRVDVAVLRVRLQAMHHKYPDGSHGEDYFNSGINAALRALNRVAGVDMTTPCRRTGPANMGGSWCGAHHGWLGQSSRWCDLAESPWTWAR
jgi:hypothetical protein